MRQTYAARYEDNNEKEYLTLDRAPVPTVTGAPIPGLIDPRSARLPGGMRVRYLSPGRYQRLDNGRIILCDTGAP